MAYLIKTDGTITEVHPAPGRIFSLQQLQEWVGGYIEIVATHTGDLMIVNEEGKLPHMGPLRVNEIATERYQHGKHDPVVGDVVICKRKEIDEPELEEFDLTCVQCGQQKIVLVPIEGYLRWKVGGELLQNALPEVNCADRELLKSGICGECWNKIFRDREEQ